MSSYVFAGIINSKKNIHLCRAACLFGQMTIFDHLQHAKQWELYLVVWNLHSRRDDEASRHQHQPSNQPYYRPGEVRKCTYYSGEEEKEPTNLFQKLAHSNFSTSWGARKTMLINMMLILFYYLWQVQMMQKLHFYTRTWKDNHSSEIWIIMRSD